MTLSHSLKIHLSIFALFTGMAPGCDPAEPAAPVDASDEEVLRIDELADADEVAKLPPLESVLADASDPQGLAPMGGDCFYGIGPGSSCIQCICVDENRAFLYYCSPCLD